MQPTSPYDENNDADPYQEPVNRPADGARMGGPEALGGDFQGGSDAQDFMNLADEGDSGDGGASSGDGLDLAPRGDHAESVEDAPAIQPMGDADSGGEAFDGEGSSELNLDGYDVADQPEVQVDASLEDSIEIEAGAEGAGGDVYEEHFGELEFAEAEEEPAKGSRSKSIVMVGFVAGVGIASTMAIVGKGDGDVQEPTPRTQVQQEVAQAPEAQTQFDEIELGVHAFAGYQPQFEPAGEGLGGAFANAFGEMLTTEVDPELAAAAQQAAPMMGEPAPGSDAELANAPAPAPQRTFENNGVEVAVTFNEPTGEDVTGSAQLPDGDFDGEVAQADQGLSDSEFGMALPENLGDRERAALLSATRYVEDSREHRRATMSFEDQLGAAGKVRVRMAGADAFEHVWNFEALPPLEAAHGENELLTPKVGGVRAILTDDELFEGALYSMGAGRVVLQTELGRLLLEVEEIDRLVQLHPMEQPELNAREVAMGDRVRVATAGGFLVGRVLKQDEEHIVLVLDSGARISLSSDCEVSHLPENRTGAFLRLVVADQ